MNSKNAYLEIVAKRKQEKADKGEALELAMPSGAVWFYLPFRLEQYAIGGKLPVHLVARLRSVQQNVGAKPMTDDEEFELGMAAMIVTREIMLNNLISPKITLEETEESITPEQIDPEDFDHFLKFVVIGGQSSQNSFRQQSTPKRKRAA
jgi:hypothetical protein